MSPSELMELVLDATNTNDYDDGAEGWLSTKVEGDVLTVTFVRHTCDDYEYDKANAAVARWKLVLL